MHLIKRLTLASACLLAIIGASSVAHAQLVYGPTFGGPGGSPFDLQCPGGGFMTGVTARAGQYVDALRPQCGSQTTAWAGGAGGTETTRFCPAGWLVKGIFGLSGGWVDSIVFMCAEPSEIKGGGFDTFDLSPVGGSGGSFQPQFLCPQYKAAVGIYGGAGQYIDRIGLICATVP